MNIRHELWAKFCRTVTLSTPMTPGSCLRRGGQLPSIPLKESWQMN